MIGILGSNFTQSSENVYNVIESIFGFGRLANTDGDLSYSNSVLGSVSNVWSFDFLYILGLAFFANFINRKYKPRPLSERR